MKQRSSKNQLYYDSTDGEADRNPVRTDAARRKFSVSDKYRYTEKDGNWFYRIIACVIYRLIMTPVAHIYCRLFLRMRFVDQRSSPPDRNRGCFLYRNHVLTAGDAFEPSVEMKRKKVYVVVDPSNLSVPGTRTLLKMCGALPVPSGVRDMKRFSDAVIKRLSEGNCVTVYPEAHVWPYYTGIRPFGPASFLIPALTGLPVFVSTTVFRNGRRPRVTTILDGPFYADTDLNRKKAAEKLCGEVREAMEKNAELSCNTDFHIKYIRRGTNA